MSATSVASGLAVVQSSLVPGAQVAMSAHCYTPVYLRGPYNGADPSSRFVIPDVARFSDGGTDPTKQFLNVVKAQAATEALLGAGVLSPKVTLARHAYATATPAVMITQNGTVSGGVYGASPYNMWAPYTGVHSTALNYGTETTPGTVIASFPNGMALTTPVPPSYVPLVASFTQTSTPSGAASLAAQALNASHTFGPPDPTIWSQLYNNGETLPYVSLFGAPTYPGDLANNHYSGADIIATGAATSGRTRAIAQTQFAVDEYARPGPAAYYASKQATPALAAAAPPSAEHCAACTGWR